MYALGSRVALTDDDSDVVERSRKLFKDAAPSFMNDFGPWIFSRSLDAAFEGYNWRVWPRHISGVCTLHCSMFWYTGQYAEGEICRSIYHNEECREL